MNDVSWTRDECTCGHEDLAHENGLGRCRICDSDVSYGRGTICTRYQWDGHPRRRTW